jgi:hypothetical protein
LWYFLQLYEESLTDHEGRYPGTPSDVFWQFSAPDGLRSTLSWIGRRYQRPEVRMLVVIMLPVEP